MPTRGPDDEADAVARRDEQRAEDEIIGLPWDDELPVALGEDVAAVDDPPGELTDGTRLAAGSADDPVVEGEPSATSGHDDHADGDHDDHDVGDDMGELSADHVGGRRNALPRRVESWRSRSATGAIATAIAMGLQQVFEPERRRPAAVAEAPSDPYDDDDPITVNYVPDDAEATTVHVKPWLLQKGEPG